MLFVNDERIDLREITRKGGYKGDDFVLQQLAKAYTEVQEIGFPIKIKCDKLRKSTKDGKTAIRIPYNAGIDTPSGTAMLVYATSSHPDKGGFGNIYRPLGENMRKTLTLDKKDIDKILFLMVGEPRIKYGTLYIEDLEKKARLKAEKRTAGSTLNFYLYNEKSPLFADEERLIGIALALGIADPDKMGVNELKNTIYERVELAEKINDGTFGYKWFDTAVDEFTPVMTALKDIQTATDKKIIRFNQKTYKWMLLDENAKDTRILCPVEPHKTSMRREILAATCVKNPEIYDIIKMGVDAVARDEFAGDDIEIERESTGDEVKRIDFASLEWHELRALAKKNTILLKGKTKIDLIKELEHRREALV